jgi:class 3 adenylate cyclase
MPALSVDQVRAWLGRVMVDRDGNRLGEITDIYLRETDRPEWAVVRTGPFGLRSSFVPLAEASEAGDQIQVPHERMLVKDAPTSRPGDGGMFHFRDPRMAVLAGLDVVQRAPASGLPAAHVGIHTGPVIAQDGDVYGRTVNLAARIASYAQAGQVVVSEDTARRSGHDDTLRFQPLGPVELKGVASPLALYQAFSNS